MYFQRALQLSLQLSVQTASRLNMHLSKLLSLSPLVAVAAADHVWQCQTIGYADGTV